MSEDLYLQALTHKSWSHENPRPDGTLPGHYERLEFLGDAVLELCVRDMLLERFPESGEGQLTPAKQQLVNNETLPDIAERIGVMSGARVGGSMRGSQGRQRRALQADMVEALLGALYLDQGLDAARDVVRAWFPDAELRAARRARHPKTELQERLDQLGISNAQVRYARVSSSGPDHARSFRVQVEVAGEVWGEGEGTSWKKASVEAASAALHRVRDP